MGKLYSFISALLIAICSATAFGQTEYEWWLDNDVSSRQPGTFSGNRLELQIDMSGVREGLHGFNCRIKNDSTWGSIYHKTILIPISNPKTDPKAEAYEYWIDDNIGAKVAGSLSAGSNAYTVDVQSLSEGLHRINYRVRTQYGDWGSLYCQYFLIPISNPKTNPVAEAYEYWIDDNIAEKVTGALSAGSNAYVVDVQSLPEGLHRLNYRVRTQYGDWSSIYCQYFCNVEKKPTPSEVSYEYWFDNDFSSRKNGALESGQMSFTVDASGLDETKDFHLFNMRIGNNVDGWGSIYQKILIFNDHKDDDKVVGYRHRINGIDLGYVEVEGGLIGSQSFMVDLPEDLGITPSYNGSLTFNGNEISIEGSDSIHYSIQVKSGMGWSAPRTWDFAMSRNFSTTAVEMAVNTSHQFDAPKAGEFAAVKFTSTGAPLYFRSDIPVGLDIYHNGEKVREFTVDEMEGMVSAELEAGEYFGILHDIADNEAGKFTFHLMDTPNAAPNPVITFADGTVTITCSRSDVEIRYTLDESDPTTESSLYEAPFQLNRNALVKARAFVPNSDINPSAVVELNVDSYKVDAPTGVFDMPTRTMTLSCATEGAAISYRIGAIEEWTVYTAPFTVGRNTTVYAKATFEGYNDSDIAEIVIAEFPDSMPMPEISFKDGMVSISCERADAEIRYTLDGTTPTIESTLYTAPFELKHNALIRAISYLPNSEVEPSEVAELVVNEYTTAKPIGIFNESTRMLTLECATEGATISYSFNPDEGWEVYTEPIYIETNCNVYAKAEAPGYSESDILTIKIEILKCEPVTISYNGRYISLHTDEPEAIIKYTVDGSYLFDGMEYTGKFDANGLCTVKAMAVKEGYQDSDVAEYQVTYYADEDHAETAAGGLLESAFGWCDSEVPENVESFRIEGYLDEADYDFIKTMKSLRHLDISSVADAHIPSYAFMPNSNLVTISLPADLKECGVGVLGNQEELCAVIWNSTTKTVESNITSPLSNPNVLVYVPAGINVEDSDFLNVIEGGRATKIVLKDGYPFYAPVEFDADEISLTRNFSKPTQIGVCGGWETLTLPFTPERIVHETKGNAVPFAAWDGDLNGDKPFWLYNSVSDGWEQSTQILPGIPYIISMPNSPEYVAEFNLPGKVTFSASGVTIIPDMIAPAATPWMEGTTFEGTFMPIEEKGLLALNSDWTDDDNLPGSMFVDYEVARPFGAYVRGAGGRKAMPLFGYGNGVSLPTVTDAGLVIETPAAGMIRVSSSRESRVAIVTPEGATVRTLHLKAGESVTVEDLTRGLYIVGNTKVMVR